MKVLFIVPDGDTEKAEAMVDFIDRNAAHFASAIESAVFWQSGPEIEVHAELEGFVL